VAVGWAVIQSVGLTIGLLRPYAVNYSPFFVFQTSLALTAGSLFVMWLSEIITERGIGNGASLLIFVNIVATLPKTLGNTIDYAQTGAVLPVVILLLVFLVMIVAIVFVQEGTRRIPIISARRQVGKRLYRERSSYLPLRLNQGGVMPIIFASSVLILPSFLGGLLSKQKDLSSISQLFVQITNALQPGTWTYTIVYSVMIFFFSYFYASLIVNPEEISKNLKKMGSSIPGIRPGKKTEEYLEGVLNRLTFLGAIFLSVVATVPIFAERATGVTTFQGLGATSLLILVGVAIDTAKQIQTYVISQRYEGMIKQD
jgi:preprotein translocase subunit SecY